jgi:hypothetical protein
MGASRKFEHRLAGAQGDAGLQGTATITDTLGMRSCDCDRKDVGRPAIPLSRLPGEPRDCLPTAQFSNRTIYGAAEEIEQTPTTEHADARLQGIVPPKSHRTRRAANPAAGLSLQENPSPAAEQRKSQKAFVPCKSESRGTHPCIPRLSGSQELPSQSLEPQPREHPLGCYTRSPLHVLKAC